MPAGSKRMLVNVSTNARSGTPYCRPWLIEMAKASMMPARVEPCFDTRTKISPGRPSSYSPTVTKPLQSATRNSNVRDARCAGSFSRTGSRDDPLDDALDDLRSAASAAATLAVVALLGRRQRLADLAVVAVDGDGLEAELPRQSMCSCSTSSTVASSGMLTVLEIAPRDERLHRPHHPHVARVVDGVVAHRAGEHRQVLGVQVRARRGSTCARRCRRRSRRSARSCSRAGAAPAAPSG